jgi:DNA-binding NtrC family response regulator
MSTNEAVLLIVDDEASVCRALSRILKTKASEIITVQNLSDAELVLDTRDVTHILCDHLLGPGQPRGLDTAIHWKAEYPTIDKIIILTGTDAAFNATPDGIDYVLPKTTDPLHLAEFLQL